MTAASHGIVARVAELTEQRAPFVHATVVRAESPASARPGDAAVVLPDGTVEGFVGGQCAKEAVTTAALGVLSSGEPLLLRILPEGAAEFPNTPGARTVINPCLSGGSIEVFLEPRLAPPSIVVVGDTPIADAVATMGQNLGLMTQQASSGPGNPEGATAVIIASHGRHEPDAIRGALAAGVGLIGLVASSKRGAAVLDELRLSADERSTIRTPIGLEIGAVTAEEIALSILGEVVQAIRVDGLGASNRPMAEAPKIVTDPVCGMSVTVGPDTPYLRHADEEYWFCNPGCRDSFERELAIGA